LLERKEGGLKKIREKGRQFDHPSLHLGIYGERKRGVEELRGKDPIFKECPARRSRLERKVMSKLKKESEKKKGKKAEKSSR